MRSVSQPHVTPAANPPAVQCSRADDVQYGVPLCDVPLTASSGAFGWGWGVTPKMSLSDLYEVQSKWFIWAIFFFL